MAAWHCLDLSRSRLLQNPDRKEGELEAGYSENMSTASWRAFCAAAVAVLAASSVRAQFAQFAAPGSGLKLYFSSPLPLQGSNEPAQGRIFNVDSNGVHTVADVTATPPTPYTSYYMLSRPELSRDGTILIYTAERGCY